MLLKQLFILSIVICTAYADLTENRTGARIVSQPKRSLSHHRAPKLLLAPAEPPKYGPLITYSHPPTSPQLSKPSMRTSETAPPMADFTPPHVADIAPSQAGTGALPTGLVQPPLSPHASSNASFIFRYNY